MSIAAQILLSYAPSVTAAADINDISAITGTSAIAFSYISMPSGPRTFLNYITSFGVVGNSNNSGTGLWQTSYSGSISYVASPITTNSYFTAFNRVLFIVGDGSNDPNDWAVINFGQQNGGGDFDGGAATQRFFGGESTRSGGAGGLSGTPIGRLWGFNTVSGWQLLYQLPLGTSSGNSYNHNLGAWFSTGTPVISGNGKRAAYNTLSITHVGFSVSAS